MRVIAVCALGLAIICGVVSVYLGWRNDGLRDQLEAAQGRLSVQARQIENARQAAAVLDAHIARLQAERAAHQVQLKELRGKEGYHAPLSDFLGDVFDGL
ncbi:hypothetical protein [Phaeobacter italicus]|uniref:hypothetical protein n=1 Tax=Phaeobacter italicus TaxID=481446 RepID=UPI0021BD63CC|nr:hypothetical protein [Phaeobacter italicus]